MAGVVEMCWGGTGWMGHGGYGGGWGWGWIVTAVVLILFFAVVITAMVVAVHYLTGAGHHGHGQSPTQTRAAEDVLAHRFARGEIDDTEYRQRMTALREHR